MSLFMKLLTIAIVAAFIAGVFVASPELRAFAAATITSADIVDGTIESIDLKGASVTNTKIAGNAITGSKIISNTITASDIAPDAVGASELQGVSSKLVFGSTNFGLSELTLEPGQNSCQGQIVSTINGDENVVVTLNNISGQEFNVVVTNAFIDFGGATGGHAIIVCVTNFGDDTETIHPSFSYIIFK